MRKEFFLYTIIFGTIMALTATDAWASPPAGAPGGAPDGAPDGAMSPHIYTIVIEPCYDPQKKIDAATYVVSLATKQRDHDASIVERTTTLTGQPNTRLIKTVNGVVHETYRTETHSAFIQYWKNSSVATASNYHTGQPSKITFHCGGLLLE